MKRRIAALALGLLLLAGCGAQRRESEQPNAVGTLRQTSGSGSVDWCVAGKTAFTVTRSGQGAFLQTIDLTDDRCAPLCPKAGCTHSGADCPAWVEERGILPYVNCLDNGNLVLYYLTNEETGGTAAVELRAADGTLLQDATALPEEGQGWSPSAFYTDGKDLYVVREERWYRSGCLPRYRLYRIHTRPGEEFGQMKEATVWELEHTAILTGQTTGQGLLVCQLTDEGQLLSELCWDGAVRTIRQAQPQQVFWTAQYSGSLEPEATVCLYDNVSGQLDRLELATGESVQTARLEPGLSLTGTPLWLKGTLYVGTYREGGEQQAFAISGDGTVEPVARWSSWNGVVRPVVPSAVMDGKLLVELSETMAETSYRDKDGRLVTGQTSEYRYGLFTPQQYMAGGADCLPIQGAF